jgi:hypothetical protein
VDTDTTDEHPHAIMTRPSAPSLGRCPDCGESLAASWKLIDYQDEHGQTRCFAECPTCDAVVKPE